MRFRLDYPGVNCQQCNENYKEDGEQPCCEKCPVNSWDTATWTALRLYMRSAQGERLEHAWFKDALNDLLIPAHERPKYRRLVNAIHREVIKYHARNRRKVS